MFVEDRAASGYLKPGQRDIPASKAYISDDIPLRGVLLLTPSGVDCVACSLGTSSMGWPIEMGGLQAWARVRRVLILVHHSSTTIIRATITTNAPRTVPTIKPIGGGGDGERLVGVDAVGVDVGIGWTSAVGATVTLEQIRSEGLMTEIQDATRPKFGELRKRFSPALKLVYYQWNECEYVIPVLLSLLVRGYWPSAL